MFKENVPLKEYSTYGIGGPAKFLVEVNTTSEMRSVLPRCDRFIVIGKGSNVLFDDKGFNGTVIINKINQIEWKSNSVEVGAGYSFSLLGSQSARKGFSGLEFASGIPGSVGGAIFMNAGANGMETKDILISAGFVHSNGEYEEFNQESLEFEYRKSRFHSINGAIVSATFSLQEDIKAKKRQKEIIEYRTSTQPYGEKTCGCTFKNPEGSVAGRLIERVGLKGFSCGGAKVSPLHANFIVNNGNATAQEVLDLIKYIQIKVYNHTGHYLEPEVRFIPYQ